MLNTLRKTLPKTYIIKADNIINEDKAECKEKWVE
ncbi:hypothetical protein SCG7109_AU_00040 [Chlamydiales bacterium SCGC AG-110-M15]|nr:hypothetical protein SCG7109_AU_00040 [Chlamydiales bacterium SCGC AG-110-M15]